MEEEGGSAAIELPMCNCGKPSAVQMSTTEKKPWSAILEL